MYSDITKGLTVVHTEPKAKKNRNGYEGISIYENNRYRVDIQIKSKKYILGIFDNLSDAVNARKVAEIKKCEGCFEEWFKTKPHGNSPDFMKFWMKEFELLKRMQ